MRFVVLLCLLSCCALAQRIGDMRNPDRHFDGSWINPFAGKYFEIEAKDSPDALRNIRVRRHAASHHLRQKGPKPAPGAEN